MNTKVQRIQLPDANLEQTVTIACDNMLAVGYRLASSFSTGTELVLIFQPA